jgi:hypothetical protein
MKRKFHPQLGNGGMIFSRTLGMGSVFTMKLRPLTLTLLLSLATILTCPADEPKLEPLFNGKDLAHFKAEESKAFWRVEDGILIGENDAAKKGNYLWTEKEYKDFVIEFDVRWRGTTPRGVDTGIEMRKPNIQLQLGISGSLKVDMSGSWYTGGKPGYPDSGTKREDRENGVGQAPRTPGPWPHQKGLSKQRKRPPERLLTPDGGGSDPRT